MFRRLLVPLDGSRVSEAVLPTAALLAEKAGAGVTLLHVIERHAPPSVHGEPHLTTAAEAEAYLAQTAARCFPPGVPVEWHVHVPGTADVPHSLAEHADELEADLVVMLAHGRKQLQRWLFGTVAQQVLKRGPTPVLLVHAEPSGGPTALFRKILVPLDGRAEHEAGLPAAAWLAQLATAPIHLLTVVPTPSALGGSEAATGQLLPTATREVLELAEQQGVQYLQRHVERLREAGLSASATVARGDPAEVIRETAARLGADLVVLGTHGSAGIEAFWSGSLGQRLLGRVKASFLLAPAKAAE